MKKGSILVWRKNDTSVIAWKDKRPVQVLSTYHGDQTQEISRTKTGGAVEKLIKPAIADHTAHMGGVDRADHYCASYNFARKSRKWWRKVFFWIMELGMVNAYILFSEIRKQNGLKAVSLKKIGEGGGG